MNNKRFILLFSTWLFVPPVFFVVSKNRGIKQVWRRLLLSLFSPMTLAFFLMLFALYLAHFDSKLETWRARRERDEQREIENINSNIPSIDSYIDLGAETAIVTDTFNFKYKNSDYCLVVARANCGASCGNIHLIVYEVENGSYIMTDKLFPKDRFQYPNSSIDIGAVTLFRNTPNLDDLTAFTERIDFNSKTRIVTYDEFIEDIEDGYIYPTGKKISWELREY